MFKKLILTTACAALFAGNASALTFNDPIGVTSLDSYVSGAFDDHDALGFSVNQSNGAAGIANYFVHYFTFTLTNPTSNLIASAIETPIVFGGTTYTHIDPFMVEFYDMGVNGVINGGDDIFLGSSSIDMNVAAGKYYMKVIGTTGGFPPYIGGTYAADISVSPVPEAETWAMMGLGLGLVGLQLRRRKSAERIA